MKNMNDIKLRLAKVMKNPYIDMLIFEFKIIFLFYIVLNLYTLIGYGAFLPVLVIIIIFVLTVPVGLIFVAIHQWGNRYYKNKIEKELEKINKK